MDLAFDDMYGLFWACTFVAVNPNLRLPNNVTGVYLGQVSLLLIGQQGLEHFFRYRSLLLIGWIVQILRQPRSKTTNTAPTTLSAMQAASQSTFINAQLDNIIKPM
jgi:hypothetical protein